MHSRPGHYLFQIYPCRVYVGAPLPGRRRNMPGAEYKVLGKGVKAVRLWESIGPKWPQIAVLLLSKNEYKEFLKNPKKYLNELKLYGAKTTKEVHRCHLAHVSTHATYAVITKHQKDCTSVVTSSFGIPL